MIMFDEDIYFEYENESFKGLSLGVGAKIILGESNGLTADLFYLLTDKGLEKQKELEKVGIEFENKGLPVKISFGFFVNL